MEKKFIIAGLLTSFALPVLAGDFYVSGDVGQSHFGIDVGKDMSINKTDTSITVSGGYKFNEVFSSELTYGSLGTMTVKDSPDVTTSDFTATQFSMLASLPVGSGASIYGRLGVAKLKADQTFKFDGQSESKSLNKTKAVYGVGARYPLNDNIGLHVEYTRYAEWEELTLSKFAIGADYHF